MIAILQHRPRGATLAADERAETLPLRLAQRRLSRQRIDLDDGRVLAIALPTGTTLAHGDFLDAEDGSVFVVVAADEAVLQVRAADPRTLARAAYHLGNRHVPVEVGADYLALEPDPVLEAMLRGLGVEVAAVHAPFQPETGAYGGGHRHGHDATFPEDHALAQAVFERHASPPVSLQPPPRRGTRE